MPFDWNTYKDLAEVLRLGDSEAAKRSAISRLYYAVYWKARLLLEKENPDFYVSSDNSHATVWRIYKDGQRLKEFRQMADYEPEIEKLADTVEASFTLAEKIIAILDQLAGNK